MKPYVTLMGNKLYKYNKGLQIESLECYSRYTQDVQANC